MSVFSVFSSGLSAFADLVALLADLLTPLFGGAATAAAIVLFTALVRLLVHPLSRAAARGQKARAALAPQVAKLRARHRRDPERLQRAVLELHAKEKVSPLSGCLPSLLQVPAFFLLYQLFSSSRIGGEANALLDHALGGAPLGDRWTDAWAHGGPFGGAGAVYLLLFLVVAVVATLGYRLTKAQLAAAPALAADAEALPGMAAMTRFMPLMGFLTLVTVAVVPLAAALYVVTSAAWTVAERALLYRTPAPAASAG
ncbi:YidC/Oxa1 family membrane protein insertase [Streptomyces sp. NPDC059578]|uniref:YidC/Oxa1 family membrane protein insertase n=1 Tax=unclassified Streptomyces TaxID=2593676 RepID=UPI00364F939C